MSLQEGLQEDSADGGDEPSYQDRICFVGAYGI